MVSGRTVAARAAVPGSTAGPGDGPTTPAAAAPGQVAWQQAARPEGRWPVLSIRQLPGVPQLTPARILLAGRRWQANNSRQAKCSGRAKGGRGDGDGGAAAGAPRRTSTLPAPPAHPPQ